MASTEELEKGGESLEEEILRIFTEARQVLSSGDKQFPAFAMNPHEKPLREAVGGLATTQLVELITGNPLREQEDEDSAFTAVVKAWSAYATGDQLHDLAYEAYVQSQNEIIKEMLSGKRITAKAREGARRSTISYSDGYVETLGRDHGEVSGIFHSVNIDTGELVLAADRPTEEIRFWLVNLVDIRDSTQVSDISIQDPQATKS